MRSFALLRMTFLITMMVWIGLVLLSLDTEAAHKDEDPTIKDIYLGATGKIIGTTAVIDFSSFDVDSSGLVSTTGGINLSGGTAGGANTIDLGSNGNDDLTATDVIDLTDGGTTSLHTTALTHILHLTTLDQGYDNDATGDAQITVDARDISFDLNDATNDYKFSIDNTSAATLSVALEIASTGVGSSITNAIDVSDTGFSTSALNSSGANITGTTYSFVTTAGGNITLSPTGDLIITGTDFSVDATGNITVAAIQADAGSSGAPAYSFSGDTNTGGYLTAAGNVEFRGNAAGGFRVLDSATANDDGLYVTMTKSATTNGLCLDNGTAGAGKYVVDCSGNPSDMAMWVETQKGGEPGDIMVASNNMISYQDAKLDWQNRAFPGEMRKSAILKKSSRAYQKNLMGVISTAPYRVMGEDVRDAKTAKNPLPLALVGRVPVKVSMENGPIAIGDPITSSSTPGVGMKATQAGPIVGIALEPFSASGVQKIMMYIMNKTSYVPQDTSTFIQKITEDKRAQLFKKLLNSTEFYTLINDKDSILTLKTMIGLHEGLALKKEDISKLKDVPTPLLHKLSYISYQLRKNGLDSIEALSENHLITLLKEAFIVDESLWVKGDIAQVVKTKNDGDRVTYAQTSNQPYLVMRGEGQLEDGKAFIPLDPLFLEAVEITQDHPVYVHVTPTALDIQDPLVVVETTNTSFTVQQANGGRSQGTFSWEISARKNAENIKTQNP